MLATLPSMPAEGNKTRLAFIRVQNTAILTYLASEPEPP